MLQIVSGMYFTSAERRETLHRRVAYSNVTRLTADVVDLPIGRLRLADGAERITAVTIEALERLEVFLPDGTESILSATSGDNLVRDVADVVAFGLNATVTLDLDLARRLVPISEDRRARGQGARVLRRVFDPAVFVKDDELNDLREMCTRLLALERSSFEAAMRAIRRVVDAAALVADDVTLAYSLYVAALESLSRGTEVVPVAWDEYDGGKRRIVEAACEGLSEEQARRVRAAVLEVDSLSLGRRFRAFVLEHVTPAFFREEAQGASRPVRSVDLRGALDFAYKVRSRGLHELRELAPELWVISDRADTLEFDGRTVLSLEGLNRLCRHVIRQYIARAPVGIERNFNYWRALPGQVQVRLAPAMWAGSWDAFNADAGPTLFEAMVEMVVGALGGDENAIVDMTRPLARIERLLPGVAKGQARIPLVATYLVWDCLAPEAMKRPEAARFESFLADLDSPGVVAFATGVVLQREPSWDSEQWVALADARFAELRRPRRPHQPLPRAFDSALQVAAAQHRWAAGFHEEASERVGLAVELLPGDERLIELERQVRAGREPSLDLHQFVLGTDPQPNPAPKSEPTPVTGLSDEPAATPDEGAP